MSLLDGINYTLLHLHHDLCKTGLNCLFLKPLSASGLIKISTKSNLKMGDVYKVQTFTRVQKFKLLVYPAEYPPKYLAVYSAKYPAVYPAEYSAVYPAVYLPHISKHIDIYFLCYAFEITQKTVTKLAKRNEQIKDMRF